MGKEIQSNYLQCEGNAMLFGFVLAVTDKHKNSVSQIDQ